MEIETITYYDDLKKYLETNEGKICENLFILSCLQRDGLPDLKKRISLTNNDGKYFKKLFKPHDNIIHELIEKYSNTTKYIFGIYYENENIEYFNLIKSFCDNDKDSFWNICAYAQCHRLNTYILYPYLLNRYPTHNICHIHYENEHTCVIDYTENKIYDLACWYELSRLLHHKSFIEFLYDKPFQIRTQLEPFYFFSKTLLFDDDDIYETILKILVEKFDKKKTTLFNKL